MKAVSCFKVALLILVAGSMAGCGGKKAEVLATVGKQTVTTKDFELAIANLPANYKVLAESYSGKHKILDNLVKKALLVQEAEKRGYPQKAEIKTRIKNGMLKATEQIDREMAELKLRKEQIERQVYENIMLNELNQVLKKEGLAGVEITPSEINTYYEDYVRKIKILNPAAEIPKLEQVESRIKAILVEENLIKSLQKNGNTNVNEKRFRELYTGEADKDATVVDPDRAK
jgi:hypothetical protein